LEASIGTIYRLRVVDEIGFRTNSLLTAFAGTETVRPRGETECPHLLHRPVLSEPIISTYNGPDS